MFGFGLVIALDPPPPTQLSFWYECTALRAENRGLENGLAPNLGS